jgi:hypothetical protein
MKKNSFAFLFTFCLIQMALDQKPVFRVLQKPDFHAGCYLGSFKKTLGNLSAEDTSGEAGAVFNLNGKDDFLKQTESSDKNISVYKNENYEISIGKHLLYKEKNSCLDHYRFDVKVIYKNKTYYYTFRGFCGC